MWGIEAGTVRLLVATFARAWAATRNTHTLASVATKESETLVTCLPLEKSIWLEQVPVIRG